LPGTSDETVFIVAHRDGWFDGANDNGSGVATMIGLAEFFAKMSPAQRKRTITFLGTTGHHNSGPNSGAWFAERPEVFAKGALLINSEHTGAVQAGHFSLRSANIAAPSTWYASGNRLASIVMNALDAFGVPTYPEASARPAGEIGRYFQPALGAGDEQRVRLALGRRNADTIRRPASRPSPRLRENRRRVEQRRHQRAPRIAEDAIERDLPSLRCFQSAVVNPSTQVGEPPHPRLLALVVLYLVVAHVLPRPESVTPANWRITAIFLATIAGLMLRPMPGAVIVLVGLMMFVLVGQMPMAEALTGFAAPSVWLVLAAMMISRVLRESGLARRIALLFVRRFGTTSLGVSHRS
jgi:hypothetical protein